MYYQGPRSFGVPYIHVIDGLPITCAVCNNSIKISLEKYSWDGITMFSCPHCNEIYRTEEDDSKINFNIYRYIGSILTYKIGAVLWHRTD